MGTSFTKINFLNFYRNCAENIEGMICKIQPVQWKTVVNLGKFQGTSEKWDMHFIYNIKAQGYPKGDTNFSVYSQAKMQYGDSLSIWVFRTIDSSS